MSAFRRRTAFAAPVIITVATGCGDKREPPAAPPALPGPSWRVVMRDMKCYASEGASERAIECPPGMSGRTIKTVTTLPDATCAVVPAGCTAVTCARPKVPCPLPAGQALVQKLAHVWVIEKRGSSCHAEDERDADHCPPGVDCNPPAPRTFPCPPGVDEEHELRVAELPDATCKIAPQGCADTSCLGAPIPCPRP